MARGSIGVDIGATKIALGVVAKDGVISSRRSFPTEVEKGAEAIVDHLIGEIKILMEGERGQVASVGVGMAGQIEPIGGIVEFAPNLRWRNFPLAQKLSQGVGAPVAVINDVRAATWGEWFFGAGKGASNFVCLFVGTGVGGGVVINGDIVTGASNCAGEFGHMVVDLRGPLCQCGNFGCLEAIAGGWAIGQKAQALVAADPSKGKCIVELSKKRNGSVTAKEVFMAAQKNDPLAVEILNGAADALVAGVITIANALNPSRIILGGGVIEGNPGFVQEVAARVRGRALASAVKELRIVKSSLENDAGIIGAANYAAKITKQGVICI